MRLTNIDRQVIYKLSKFSSWTYINLVFAGINIPVNELIKSVLRLEKREVLRIFDDSKISFTPMGRSLAQEISSDYQVLEKKAWREVPAQLKREVGQVNDFYIPRISLLSKKCFKL